MALLSLIFSYSEQPATTGLTVGGWIFVTIAWTTIIGVAAFCYRKVLLQAAIRNRRE